MINKIINKIIRKLNAPKIKIQHSYNKEEHYVVIDGIKLYLDKYDGLKLSKQPYEIIITEWVKNKIKNNDYVVDVGANIGYYTTLLAKSVGVNGKVYAFEPEPNNYSIVVKNVVANNFNNVHVFNNAVGKEKGILKLYKSKDDYRNQGGNGMHRVYPSIFCDEEPIKVNVVKLDDIIDHDVRFIKLDAEGSELDILKGMKKILNQEHLLMLLEYGPASIIEKGDNPYEIIQILKNAGLRFYHEKNNNITEVDNLDKYIDWLNGGNLTNDIRVANFMLEK